MARLYSKLFYKMRSKVTLYFIINLIGYNALLNSKLFSGGIEKCHFSGGKEAIWMHLTDIINEFEAGHL